jgi:ribulose kinase
VRNHPHAWVKLWKHHAAQPEADLINEVARQRGEPWLPLYGGKISSEWFYSKALQVLNETPEAYQAADRFIEAADWVIWQLIGLGGGSPHQAGLAKVMPLLQHTPAARIARPEQLASVIAFLASLEASNVNGAILPADYGWSAV